MLVALVARDPWQSEVAGIKQYHDKHMDLVSAGRDIDGGVWGGGMDPNPLPAEIIKGMPADWLKRHLGEETSRQVEFLLCTGVISGRGEGRRGLPIVGANRCGCLVSMTIALGSAMVPGFCLVSASHTST